MNTYLYPLCDYRGNRIETLVARSQHEAEQKLYNRLFAKYDFTESDNLKDLRDELIGEGIEVGDLYEIDQFTSENFL